MFCPLSSHVFGFNNSTAFSFSYLTTILICLATLRFTLVEHVKHTVASFAASVAPNFISPDPGPFPTDSVEYYCYPTNVGWRAMADTATTKTTVGGGRFPFVWFD